MKKMQNVEAKSAFILFIQVKKKCIYAKNFKWQVVSGSNLNSLLKLLFYLPIIVCYLKFVMKILWT